MNVGSYKDGTTLSWVKKDCAFHHESVGHEIAHNFGCDHDYYWNGNPTNKEFPYGHGHVVNDGPEGSETAGYGTIMARRDNDAVNFRVNYYSNPRNFR